MWRSLPPVAVALLLTARPASVAGQEDTQPTVSAAALKNLSLEELSRIEITSAEKQPETVWRTAAAVFVITAEDIRRSGATTLPDVLRLAPGVLVNQSDSNRWAVGVRGFADIFSKSVLVLIDGRSIYTPLVGGVHWAIQDLVLADIQQIEVIRGPGGAIWGANAVNGVINVVTKDARRTQGLLVSAAAGGPVERGRAAVRHGGQAFGGALHYRVYGKGFNRGPQFHPTGGGFDAWNSVQAGTRADWKVGPHDLMLSGDVYRTQAGERATVSFYAPPSTQDVDGEVGLTGGNAIFRWDRAFGRGARSRFQAYYDRTNRDGFTFRELRNTFDADLTVRMARRRRHELTAGIGARVSPSRITQVVPTLDFLPHTHTHRLWSAFLQDDIALLDDRLSLALGAKLEHNSYSGTEVLPSARARFTPGARQSLWGAVTRSVRTPSRFDRDLRLQVLVASPPPTYVSIVGSPDFDSETVWGSEAGYRALIASNLLVDVAAFHNAYDKLAGFGEASVTSEAAPLPHVRLTIPFVNSVEASTSGFEIAPDWKPLGAWQLKGSYSYLWVSASNDAGFRNVSAADNYMGLAPRHQVRVQSRLDLSPRWQFDQTYRFVGELSAQAVPGYHTLDARVSWRASDRLELSLVGQNLLQPHHPEFDAVGAEIRRGAYAEVTVVR